jgi:zinc transport system ATP-binding protein
MRAEEPDDSVIVFEDVTFSYERGAVSVIEKATFRISRCDSVCVIGPNGGGKSTLLKLVLGLVKPQSGSIRVLGVAPEEARKRIGYMPQHLNFDPKFPITALDLVLMGRLGWCGIGPYRKADRDRALAALDRVDLRDQARSSFSSLSGGQRQRVLIARALVGEPELLLLDEPTANVDQAVEAQFLRLLEELKETLTVVMVSHDLGFVYGNVEHALCVNRSVHLHPTVRLTGQSLESVFGMKLAVVRHGEECPEGEHIHHHG